MGTDFFDEDLVREREAALKIKLDGESGGSPRDGFIPSSRDLPNRPVSDLTLTHLARHKQEVTEQMVDKTQELDRLRAGLAFTLPLMAVLVLLALLWMAFSYYWA